MDHLVEFLKTFIPENWFRPRGLIAAIILELLIIPPLVVAFPLSEMGVNDNDKKFYIMGLLLFVILCTVYAWFRYRVPKSDLDKINIGICINAEDKDAQLAHTDFVSSLRSLLADNDATGLFNVIIYSQPLTKEVKSNAEAFQFGQKHKLVMLIWGRVFTRPAKDEAVQHLAIQSMLFHSTFTPSFQQKLSQRFGSVMPARAKSPLSLSTEMCEFTASQTNLAVKLMISLLGIAYGDFKNAERWLKELGSVRQVAAQVRREIQKQTEELYLQWLGVIGWRFVIHRDREGMRLVPQLWENYRRHGGNSLSAATVRAQAYVLVDRNARKANEILESHLKEMRSSRMSQAYWFSRAFCYAYLDDLNKAYKAYQVGLSSTRDTDDVAVQCEVFINEILQAEPARTSLYFCLGFLNYKVKIDLEAAKRDLLSFISKCSNNEQVWARRIASGWLDEITQKMSTAG